MEDDRSGFGRNGRVNGPTVAKALRILISPAGLVQASAGIDRALGGAAWTRCAPGEDADIAFVTRDVTGLSTKHTVLPDTQRFYDALLAAPSLRWLHVHSAGADRPIFVTLMQRGVALTTSSGANARIVVQTALAGILALARRFPQLHAAQRARQWSPLMAAALPRDLEGQTVVLVGWGPIARELSGFLRMIGMRIIVVRSSDTQVEHALETVAFEDIGRVLSRADWLVLACPLTPRTRGLIDQQALALMPVGAHVVNIARGEVIDEPALIDALSSRSLAGAFLDVFAHEPLPQASPLWALDNVVVTPHSAGHSDGNGRRVLSIFLDNLERWHRGEPLRHQVA